MPSLMLPPKPYQTGKPYTPAFQDQESRNVTQGEKDEATNIADQLIHDAGELENYHMFMNSDQADQGGNGATLRDNAKFWSSITTLMDTSAAATIAAAGVTSIQASNDHITSLIGVASPPREHNLMPAKGLLASYWRQCVDLRLTCHDQWRPN